MKSHSNTLSILADREKTGKHKALADDLIVVRSARPGSGKVPLIISIPQKIADIMKIEKGQPLEIMTDGEVILIKKHRAPEF
jgi:hypothetical protein